MTSRILLSILVTTLGAVANGQTKTPGRILKPVFSSVTECAGTPAFVKDARQEVALSLDKLPKTLMVARDVEYFVEGQSGRQNFSAYGYQSFLKAHTPSQVICGTVPDGFKYRFSIVAPTLIDTQLKGSEGMSLWNFQLLMDDQKIAFWNTKSLHSSETEYQIYQKSHQEYELVIKKKDGDLTQYLSIRFDAIRK